MSKIILNNRRYYYFLEPWESDYDIGVIANSISKLCRYNGHVHTFYSVAEHSFAMSYRVPPGYELYALMHDAHEAFIGDITTPIKRLLGNNIRELEGMIQKELCTRFGLDYEKMTSDVIHTADRAMYMREFDALFGDGGASLWCLDHEAARDVFLTRFEELTK